MLYIIQMSSCEEVQTELRNALLQQFFGPKVFGDSAVLCWGIDQDAALIEPSAGTRIFLVPSL